MAHPSLRQLDIFAQMVASGSVALCARELGLSPEEVERDMASLELRLGYRLFDRAGGAARLTQAGHKTAQALTLLSRDEAAGEPSPAPVTPQPPAPAAPPPAPDRPVSIVLAAPAPIFGHFQEALAAFEDANRDIAITVDLRVHLAGDAIDAFARRSADIAYFYTVGEPSDIESRYGWSEQLNLFAGATHPLARAGAVSRDQVARTPLLAMGPRNGLRRISEAAMALAGLSGAGPSGDGPLVQTDNMFDIVTALRDGRGLFPAFGPLARDLGRMPGISRIALDIPLPPVEIRQAVRPDARDDMAVEALADYLFL